ncbi:glycoside hydrolase family 16 protein [Amycolatopsis sp. GM8]|uniref:glycoside hydrolase family 16 protein n=1 Tax=Amycolatopsis sp. GM8 TaxID=2896530 RepID=UPI001F0253D0|nr:glycoside hydrolase family 16 protein [Amycolatopsis sp. GM8]
MRLRRFLGAFGLFACAVVVAALGPGVTASGSGAVSAALTPTWSDDFDGPAGSAPDAGRWGYDIGGGGWGNNEREYYTNSTANAALDGQGHLVITARKDNASQFQCWYGTCQYTSARLLTAHTFTQKYGHFEARVKMPPGQGMWPAFWMQGDGGAQWPNNGEIDIMETVGFDMGTNHGSLHGPGYSGGNPLTGTYTLPGGAQLSSDYHTYAVDWGPGGVVWSLDGMAVENHLRSDAGGNTWVFDHPFFMILNLAVGGNWPGDPNSSTVFPATMSVDYIHVSSGAPAQPAGRITGLAGKCVDDYAALTGNTNPITLYDCNGTSAQTWTRPGDGTMRVLGKCLDVTGGGTGDGTKVQLYDCNGSGAQQWVVTAANDIVNPQANKCLDVTGNNSANGNQLQIWTCAGTANQKWTYTTPGA